jgi:hypothetical protein
MNIAFSKEEIQIAKEHMKKRSTSLSTKETQNKIILRFYPTIVRMTIIQDRNNIKC